MGGCGVANREKIEIPIKPKVGSSDLYSPRRYVYIVGFQDFNFFDFFLDAYTNRILVDMPPCGIERAQFSGQVEGIPECGKNMGSAEKCN